MVQREEELDCLLALIEEHVDIDHLRSSDERQLRALTWEEVDRPPLVVQHRWGEETPFGEAFRLPSPWDTFARYSYDETFDSPAAMLQNMLLDFVVPGILLKDDSPLAIRNNHGTIQIASLLGADWEVPENDFPWIRRFESEDRVRELAPADLPVPLEGGVLAESLATLEFYSRKLAEHPPCREAIQIAMPDLQGPLDTAEQLWGSDIYCALSDDAELFSQVLTQAVDAMLSAEETFRKLTLDRLDPASNTQHGYQIAGRLLIRNDSAIMLSPSTYGEFIRPHDARVLREVGSGSIHFCGNGQHLIEKMLDIPDLRGLDFGQPELMDVAAIYAMCRERKVAVTNLNPSRDDLLSGKAVRDFPTGCVFLYHTDSVDDAREVVQAYRSNRA